MTNLLGPPHAAPDVVTSRIADADVTCDPATDVFQDSIHIGRRSLVLLVLLCIFCVSCVACIAFIACSLLVLLMVLMLLL